jgi:hypothetical protein
MAKKGTARGKEPGAGVGAELTAARRRAKERRARAEQLVALVERRKRRIVEDFYDIGEALRELSRSKLYVELGHTSFEEMLEARQIMGRTQAFKLIEVVEAFTRVKALELGAEKAYALVRLAAATPAADSPQQLAERGVVVGRRRKAAGEASVREIAQETRQVRAKGRGAAEADPEQREASGAARRVQAGLRKAGARGAQARAKRGAGGWVVEITVPVAEASVLERAGGRGGR